MFKYKSLYFFTISLSLLLIISCNKHERIETLAEAKWRGITESFLESYHLNDNLENEPHAISYIAFTYANLYGWKDKRTIEYLNKLYKLIDLNGYGLGYEWDAFQDGSINNKETNYTITITDHIGITLLEGFKNNAVSELRLKNLTDLLIKIPNADSLGYGNCISYSDNKNDIVGCVHNVNIGTAYFLNGISKLGIYQNQSYLLEKVNKIIERELFSYIKEKKNYYYWDKSKALSDQNHLAYQAWCLVNIKNDKTQLIGKEIIHNIFQNKVKDISSLIGQIRLLKYYETDNENLYEVLNALIKGEKTDYTGSDVYSLKNPRIIASIALWSSIYFTHLKGKNIF